MSSETPISALPMDGGAFGPVFSELPEGLECIEAAVEAGLFGPSEVHLCATYARLMPEVTEEELLALAVAARAPRMGHVCVDLGDPIADRGTGEPGDAEQSQLQDQIRWPAEQEWSAALRAGCLADTAEQLEAIAPDGGGSDQYPVKPLVLDGSSLYLHRMYAYERSVAADLLARAGATLPAGVGELSDGLDATLEALFSTSLDPEAGSPEDPGARGSRDQALAARTALLNPLSVITGGPGTGKTSTIARTLVAGMLHGMGPRILIAAPTGKAAQRVSESVASALELLRGTEGLPGLDPVLDVLDSVVPTTIHRLLESLPNERFRRHASRPLEADVVVIDETSMISLWMMGRLLEAVPPSCRLVLVGDPDQLVSIDAGTVLNDIVTSVESPEGDTDTDTHAYTGTDTAIGSGPAAVTVPITRLTVSHRFGHDDALADLFEAARLGDRDQFFEVLDGSDSGTAGSLRWIAPSSQPEELAELEARLCELGADGVEAARAGDVEGALAAMLSQGVLASTRGGPGGLYDWSDRIENGVVRVLRSRGLEAIVPGDPWYLGRPVMVTRNDPRNGVSNGDVGVVVSSLDDRGFRVRRVALAERSRGLLEPSRLDSLDTWWAMTIHKSQGSEFANVVVSLTRAESRILSRQLLYTALTRTKEQLTIVAEREALVAALERPVARGSKLRERLRSNPDHP